MRLRSTGPEAGKKAPWERGRENEASLMVAFDDNRLASALFGRYGENLALVERRLGVTIYQRGEEQVEEYRIQGKLYMIRVTPRNAPPYYLIDFQGNGQFLRRDSPDPGFSPPMWVIHRF